MVQAFVKDYHAPGASRSVGLVGFYDFDHLDDLARDALTHSGKAKAIYVTLNPIDPRLITRCPNRLGPSRRGLHATKQNVTSRRCIFLDFDPVREADVSATDEEKQFAKDKMEVAKSYLSDQGWPLPITGDSGNGFHLVYRVKLPADDGGLVKRVLKSLSNQFSDDRVDIDTTVHDAVRLIKLPGTMACKGQNLPERPHRKSRVLLMPKGAPRPVPRKLLEKIAAEVPVAAVPTAVPSSSATARVIGRARAYLAKMAPAISGQHGHDATFAAACTLVIGFNLSIAEALPLMQAYNERCQPAWPERELRRKLDEADKKTEPRGQLRLSGNVHSDPYASLEPLDGEEFFGSVPDFSDASRYEYLAPLSDFSDFKDDDLLEVFLAWRMQRSDILVPDRLLQQCLCGARNRNWRATLKRRLELGEPHESDADSAVCAEGHCLLFGTGLKHQHYYPANKDFGLLEEFADKKAEQGHRRFQLHNDSHKELKKALRSKGELLKAYWPALLFGRSRKIGWTHSQQRLLVGIVYELTRANSKFSRHSMQGQLYRRSSAVTASKGVEIVGCPLLAPDQEYVAFAGNGKRRGEGYMIVGRTSRGWLHRAGHPDALPEGAERLRMVSQFLGDLAVLADDLGLIPAAYHRQRREWKDIHELLDCLKSGCGCDWLEECILRIYTEANWRVRWRYFFAKKLGFRWIPASAEDFGPGYEPEEESAPGEIRSAAQVREFLKDANMTQAELAEVLDCSRKRVSRHLNGQSCSPRFFAEVNEIRTAMGHQNSPKGPK